MMTGLARRHAARLVAVAAFASVLAASGALSSESDPVDVGGRFAFDEIALPDASHETPRTIRDVNPSLRNIDAWISAVGAAVAVTDLDGNGRDDDACQVDPRFDSVTAFPLPRTGSRFGAIDLRPTPLPYDAATTAPMGCLPGDYDEDGRIDLLVYYWGRAPVIFLRRASGFRPRELLAHPRIWNSNAAALADVDGDGHVDVILGNYFNDGDRVLDRRSSDSVSMQSSMSRATNGAGDRIFLWVGPGRFREAKGAFPRDAARGWTLALGAQDLNGDLLPEIYIANDFGNDHLLVNRSRPGHVRLVATSGRRTFSTLASKVLGRDSFKSMGVDFGDINEDRQPDILVSNITTPFALHESNFLWTSTGGKVTSGRAPYEDRSEDLGVARTGWSWDTRLDDFDADGTLEALVATGFLAGDTNRWAELQELAIANDGVLADPGNWPRFDAGADLSGHEPNAFFARNPSGRFSDIAAHVGMGREQNTRALATGDVNADGRLDLVVANQWQPSYLYLNRCERCGRSLGLRLLLPSGGPAIGAVATVQRSDGVTLTRQVDGGSGHSGKRSRELFFGLGDRDDSVAASVRWRDANGRVRSLRRTLSPGRHAIVLGGTR